MDAGRFSLDVVKSPALVLTSQDKADNCLLTSLLSETNPARTLCRSAMDSSVACISRVKAAMYAVESQSRPQSACFLT